MEMAFLEQSHNGVCVCLKGGRVIASLNGLGNFLDVCICVRLQWSTGVLYRLEVSICCIVCMDYCWDLGCLDLTGVSYCVLDLGENLSISGVYGALYFCGLMLFGLVRGNSL